MTENKQILMTESLQQNVSEKRLTHYITKLTKKTTRTTKLTKYSNPVKWVSLSPF